jgi:anti-sigma28 factor (negative regulator of flagellin synthesis)
MVGVHGVGGIPEPAPDRSANLRDRRQTESSAKAPRDGIQISSSAQEAASVARLVQLAGQQGDVRAERVAAARERIEKGEFKFPEVVSEVAKRLSKLLP